MTFLKNAQATFDQFDEFFVELVQDDSIKILLTVEVANGPGLQIKINNNVIYNNILNSGEHTIELDHSADPKIVLDIAMYGKTPKDTVVQNNQIVQDKFIIIKELMVNNFDLFNDQDLFYSKFVYLDEQNNVQTTKSGFWANNTLRLYFTTPFACWHTENSYKNSQVADSLHYRNNSLTDEVFADLVKNIGLLT